MYEVTTKEWVMPGEPHLGKTEETELIVDKYEVEDLILGQLFDDKCYPEDWVFTFRDDKTDEWIFFNGSDYIDTGMVEMYFIGITEDEVELSRLYNYAGVDAPEFRKGK